jgi:hypothetical protein
MMPSSWSTATARKIAMSSGVRDGEETLATCETTCSAVMLHTLNERS